MGADAAGEMPLDLFALEVAADPLLTGFAAALADRQDLAQRSRETYLERVGHFLGWLRETGGFGDALHSVAGRDRAVDAYIGEAVEDRGVAGRTVNLSLSAMSAFYGWLGLGEVSAPRVMVDPICPRTLGLAEQRALLTAAAARGPRAYALIVLGLDAGPRKAELCALDLTDLNLSEWPGALEVPESTGGHRRVTIAPGTRAALVAWLAERRRLLRGRSEQRALFLTEVAPHRLAHRTLDDAVRAIGHDAGLDISPGTLRATAEQRMLRDGMSPAAVAARLGQQSPDPDRVSALLGGARSRRHRVALTDSEQLDLFGDVLP